jgi:hypothetical protein
MTVYELLFIAVVLAAAATLVGAAIQAASRNIAGAAQTLRALAFGAVMYLGTVCFVSLTTGQKVRQLGTQDCSDDWCVTPFEADVNEGSVTIDFKVWSRAKRAAQREFGVRPYLVDDSGRRFDAYESSGPPFDRRIEPNESFLTTRRYRVDASAKTLDLVLRSGSGPDAFVIGHSQSLLHKRTVYRIAGR